MDSFNLLRLRSYPDLFNLIKLIRGLLLLLIKSILELLRINYYILLYFTKYRVLFIHKTGDNILRNTVLV